MKRAASWLLAAVVATLPGTAAADPPAPDPTAGLVAQGFVVALLGGDLPTAEGLAATPFSLDGTVAPDVAALHQALSNLVQSRRLSGRRLLRMEVLSAEQAEARFGPPPGRLRELVAPRTVVALLRLNRGGLAVFVRRVGPLFRVIGVTD